MKKLISSMLVLMFVFATLVSAERREVMSEPIDDFRVFKWISTYASNEVAVLTVNSGERGYVVISVTSEEAYVRALDIARDLLKSEPTELFGTHFAYVRAEV